MMIWNWQGKTMTPDVSLTRPRPSPLWQSDFLDHLSLVVIIIIFVMLNLGLIKILI